MTEILIDTNVLVYAHDLASEKKRAQAIHLVNELQQARLGCLSIQCISEFFNTVTRNNRQILALDEAVEQTQVLINSFPVFPLTSMVVLDAILGSKKYHIAYYDAQIWACAHLNQISLVFSEDFSDGQIIEGVRFVNPFTETFELEKWIA
jgi:predicted nucleic acid-binding protein